MSSIANRGDTLSLTLDYTLDGVPLKQGAYDDIELQIGKEGTRNSIKLLLSKGDIKFDTKTNKYVAFLDQKATFKLQEESLYQLRIKVGADTVASTEVERFNLGTVLSNKEL